MRSWFVAALMILLTGAAFHMAADSAPTPFRKRFQPGWIDVAGDWSPPSQRHGRPRVIENLVARPRMNLSVLITDTFRLRIFYVLSGSQPADVRLAGKKIGQLQPNVEWSREVLSTPLVAEGSKPELSFDLPEGERVSIRRLDYRNYFFRVASLLLIKPHGGSRSPYSPVWLGITMVGVLIIWIVGGGLRQKKRGGGSLRKVIPTGCIAIIILLLPVLFGMSVHAHPGFLSAIFLMVAGVGALPRLRLGWKRIAGRLALGVASTAVTLLIIEGMLHVWDPPISRPRIGSYARFSPEYGWVNRPGTEGWQVDIGYHIRINRYGHRGPDYPEKKSPGVFRILALGDSFTFGWGVEDHQTFSRILESRLRKAGHQVEVWNAAVPAWHSIQSLHYLRKAGVPFQPDLVVMSFFVDDVYYRKIDGFLKSNKAIQLRDEETAVRNQKKSLTRKFRLYNVWFNYRKNQRAVREHLRRNPYQDFESERKALPRNSGKNLKLIEGVERVVSEWTEARESLKIPMIFSYIPAGGALNAPEYQGEFRELKRVSQEKKFPFLDVVSLFEKYPEPRKLYLHPKDGHMSAAGHAIMGEALSKKILGGDWLKK